jgi:hypothetical protein
MSDALVGIALLGIVAGGAIVVIDSLILRRIRRGVRRDDDQR